HTYLHHRDLRSFPTRRSSDLGASGHDDAAHGPVGGPHLRRWSPGVGLDGGRSGRGPRGEAPRQLGAGGTPGRRPAADLDRSAAAERGRILPGRRPRDLLPGTGPRGGGAAPGGVPAGPGCREGGPMSAVSLADLPVLRAEGLVKAFRGRRVVDDVTLEVHRGEVVGLLGPNGAGKSTSFNMIVGMIRPDEGRVYLGDRDLTREPMYRRARAGLGYLPQEASIFRKLTVRENF